MFIAAMFVLYGADFVTIARKRGEAALADEAQEHIRQMVKAVDSHGWDGEWFLRAYDFYGRKVGSRENEEGKIFIESQGMCVMAGIGLEDGRALQALTSVNQHLACEYGIVLTTRPLRSTICSLVRYPAIRRDTRKTPAYSATTIPG
ncbi:MAG: hypothetical protein U5L72_10170 [Bacteroidales bacterium]|nr:hypothetical protein [Bacteroidales bacterium]